MKGKLVFTQTLFHPYKYKITFKQDDFSLLNKLLLMAGLLGIQLEQMHCRLGGKTESRSLMRVDYYGLDLTLVTGVKVFSDHVDDVTLC